MAKTQYQQIAEEIETGNVQKDLWVQAFEKANGNQNKAASHYITLRAEQLYQENTNVFKRTAHKTFDVFDVRTKRGIRRLVAAVFITSLILLFSVQPALSRTATRRHKDLCEKVRQSGLIGKKERDMYAALGNPTTLDVTESWMAYVYNPAPTLCLSKKKFDLRIFVENQTGLIVGWESQLMGMSGKTLSSN